MAVHSSFASVSCLTRLILRPTCVWHVIATADFPEQSSRNTALRCWRSFLKQCLQSTGGGGALSWLHTCVSLIVPTILFSFLLLNSYSLNVVSTICSFLQLQVHRAQLKMRCKRDKNAWLQMYHQHQTISSNDFKQIHKREKQTQSVCGYLNLLLKTGKH